MKSRYYSFSTLIAVAVVSVLTGPASADPSLPWDLRNHYSIPIETGVMVYAEDNAEWRVLQADGTILADGIGFSITLADGTELTGLNLGDGTSSRDPFTHVLGDGTTYSVTFAPKGGVQVTHILRTFKERPFVFVEIEVKNVGTDVVGVTSIRPVVAETSVMQALSPETTIHYRRLKDVGGQPVVVSEEDATMALIHDPVKSFCFGVGLLPVGQARSSVAFRVRDGEWHGEIACRYEPVKTLAAGQSVTSDPLWISHGVPDTHRVDLNYSWTYSTFVESPERNFLDRGWYTLDETKGLDDYVAASAQWKSAGINHVLLGRGWEGRPGSFQGAAPRFPKGMKGAIGSLVQAELKVGVTIDPLVAGEGGQGWTADSSDGQAWLNPSAPEAVNALGDKIKTLKDWGVTFIVIDPSMIPDTALQSFNLTRSEAQNAAYKALRLAAAPIPVFPASVSPVGGDVDDWLDVGSGVARMAYYGIVPGPLGYAVDGNAKVSKELVVAASLWPGPIEFKGTLNRNQRDEFAALISEALLPGHPMDAEIRSPRNWQVKEYDEKGTFLQDRTVSLSGVSAVGSSKKKSDEENPAS